MWKRFKKRLRSKTYHAATYLMGVGIVVDQYTPEIKQAIAEGRFEINAGAIADRLISSARELVDAQRRA